MQFGSQEGWTGFSLPGSCKACAVYGKGKFASCLIPLRPSMVVLTYGKGKIGFSLPATYGLCSLWEGWNGLSLLGPCMDYVAYGKDKLVSFCTPPRPIMASNDSQEEWTDFSLSKCCIVCAAYGKGELTSFFLALHGFHDLWEGQIGFLYYSFMIQCSFLCLVL